jgi:hypothetical protein
MQSGNYDVVIAAYSDHTAIESTAGNSNASGATFLPVARSKDEEKVAKESYEYVMVADRDDIKNYLKAIHKTLKAKA